VVLRHPENAAATAKRDSDIKRGVGGAGTIASGVGSLLGNKTVKQVGDKVQEEATTLGDMLNVMAKGYDRGWEYDADRSALDLLARLGYDPLALKRVLQKLGVRKEGFLTGWDKTHPPPQDRVAEIDKIVDQRQKEGKPLRGQVEPVRTQRFQAAMVNVK
jgi:predicted Zn-dependent protease